ncbi:MAG: hypothetical protein IJT63_00360 [Lachnospiraceae bacterium]|nr:hypothetical protein [Lachnospiraceae bacterium]
MNNVSGYGIYQNAGMVGENIRKFGGKRAEGHERPENRPENAANKPGDKRTDNVNGILNGVELSDGAKKILEELKEKYGNNTDFFVANYSSEEEAQDYLSRGTKEYSVLIEPELLEEMARDSEAKEKYMGIIENGTKQLDEMKEELAASGKDGDVKNIGFSVNKDGTLSFFAQLEQSTKAQAERIAEKREKNAEKAEKEAEKRSERLRDKRDSFAKDQIKKATVKAESAEELLEKIKNFDWETVKAEEKIMVGSKVDFTA